MGLVGGTVKLEDYNPEWVTMFQEEKNNLKKKLSSIALSFEHIGSTSVVGLKAKPIIDIAVGVKKLTDFEGVRKLFEHYPYSYKIDYENDEVLIRKHNRDIVTHFIHFMEIDSERYKNTILFRNYLNSHKDVLDDYQKLKEELALKYPNERKKYTSSKNDFIQNVLRKAKYDS